MELAEKCILTFELLGWSVFDWYAVLLIVMQHKARSETLANCFNTHFVSLRVGQICIDVNSLMFVAEVFRLKSSLVVEDGQRTGTTSPWGGTAEKPNTGEFKDYVTVWQCTAVVVNELNNTSNSNNNNDDNNNKPNNNNNNVSRGAVPRGMWWLLTHWQHPTCRKMRYRQEVLQRPRRRERRPSTVRSPPLMFFFRRR